MSDEIRIDKWLWAARFYKTRALAQTAIENGRVTIDGQRVKPARVVRIGDTIGLRAGDQDRSVLVRALSAVRGPAPVAQALYEETAESVARRERIAAERRLHVEPARAIAHGRPTKHERRELERFRKGEG
ncbi:MAG: S4 domain-containing protein [Burkholderiaceae bacterium]|nr:S4 domain-containing protein [Burkholderiaceae bacterium]MEB2320098.1 S4 domain-containing protein [Pseudomonadota bacterium]